MKLFKAYRVLAPLVGVLLLTGVVAVLLCGQIESLTLYDVPTTSLAFRIGQPLTIVWAFHGWFYIAYLIVAFMISRRAGWTLPFFGLMLIAGLIPGLIFWVEHHVVQKLRAEHPELLATT